MALSNFVMIADRGGAVHALYHGGARTLYDYAFLQYIAKGDWRPVLALSVGCLICGWFWEVWNFWSYPKWVYDVPFVGVFKVFEMPALGYGGYLPFALELYALYHLMLGILGRPRWDYVQLALPIAEEESHQ